MIERTILLACAAGMSTSLIVAKMKKAAEIEGLFYNIYAVSAAGVDRELENRNIDLLLLSPQIKFMKNSFEKQSKQYDSMVDVISIQDYGSMNGEKVFKKAQELL